MNEFSTKLGTAFNADCFEVMKRMPDGCVDMILADLPYGTTACKWDNVIPFEPMWKEFRRITKKNAAIVLTASQPFTSALVMSNVREFKYEWVWRKNKATGFLNAKIMPLRNHESVLVFCGGKATYNPQMTTGRRPVNSFTKHTSDGDTMGKTKVGVTGGGQTTRYPTTVVEFAVVNQDGTSAEGKHHPTQKPVALFEYLVRTYTNEGGLVFDPTAGSLTTAVAAENLNRRWAVCEQLEEYFDKGVARFK